MGVPVARTRGGGRGGVAGRIVRTRCEADLREGIRSSRWKGGGGKGEGSGGR